MEASAGVSIGIRLLAKIWPWAIGRFFSAQRLDALLDVQPEATGECVDINFFARRATCWLRFSNLTPFALKVDRLEVKVALDGLSVILLKILPEDIPTLGNVSVFCEGVFDCESNAIEIARKAKRVRIEVRGYVVSSARNFSITRYFENVVAFRVNA